MSNAAHAIWLLPPRMLHAWVLVVGDQAPPDAVGSLCTECGNMTVIREDGCGAVGACG